MEDQLIAFGSEVKALDGGKVGGFLVRFSNPDEPDLEGDFFDVATDLNIPETLPVLYNHGMDGTIKKRVIGKATTIIEDAGVWAESQLNMRDEYEKAIYEMAKAGKLGYSSGALSHLVEREPAGKAFHIKSWFIGEVSLTPTPAEFRNTVVSLKSLIPSDAALSDNDDETKPIMEKKNMEENDVKALTEQAIADALKKRDEQAAKEAELKAAREAELEAAKSEAYKQAVADLKSRKVRYHSTEPVDDDNDGAKAFKSWAITGQVNDGLIEPDSSYDIKSGSSKAAWNVTTGASGGYLVPDPLFNQINAKRNLASWVRQLPVQMFQTSADHLLVPAEDTSMTAFTQTAEAAAYTENEATVKQVDLILYKYTKVQKMSEEFMQYNSTNWESWFADALGRAVATTENTIFTQGVGTTAPEGVVVGATVANTTATTDIILPAELSAFFGYLGAGYNVRSECGLLMNNTTKWYLAGYTGNPFTYQQTPAASGVVDQIMGYPVVVDDDVVVYTTASAKCILFGNFRFYGVVEKPGIVVQRNPYLYMANGQVGLFASIFRGGGVLQSEAFYYLTNHS